MFEQIKSQTTDLAKALNTIAINGAYDASRSLSKWLHKGVHLHTEGFERINLEDVCQGPEMVEPVVGLHMLLTGHLHGHTLLVLTLPVARELVDTMMGKPIGTTQELDEMARSCLEETANIVSNAFANSWAKWLNIDSELRPPQLHMDYLEVILQAMLIDQAMVSDEICLARTEFHLDEKRMDWEYYLLPTQESLHLLEESIG